MWGIGAGFCHICLAGVDQLADLLSCFLRRRGQDMAVDVHGSGDVLVAQTFLSYLDVNTLKEHDRRTQMSEIVEAAFGQLGLLQQFGQHLAQVLGIDRLAILVDDDVVRYLISGTHSHSVLDASATIQARKEYDERNN